ncbi:MAG: hypothetical protein ACYTGH_21535, partial [Planctomycetota bacterium]
MPADTRTAGLVSRREDEASYRQTFHVAPSGWVAEDQDLFIPGLGQFQSLGGFSLEQVARNLCVHL